ncbi:MAG: hypothetical protein AAF447_16090, partial [Myxococcota bacterium]
MAQDHPARVLAHFFKRVPGCVFASSFSDEGVDGRITFASFPNVDAATVTDINGQLDACGRRERAACIVFPSVASGEDLVRLLELLSANSRWRCRVWEPGSTRLCVDWRTQSGSWSQTLGLAPLFSMPATRRTPYLAIA